MYHELLMSYLKLIFEFLKEFIVQKLIKTIVELNSFLL
jgi:hypothetical protein